MPADSAAILYSHCSVSNLNPEISELFNVIPLYLAFSFLPLLAFSIPLSSSLQSSFLSA
jgi:hypothetical protein